MRKNGLALLQSFTTGPVLYAPEEVGNLRALAEAYAHNGGLSNLVSNLAAGLGMSNLRDRREDIAVSNDQLCAAFGMGAADRSKPFAFADGIAVIPITGSLLHRDNYSDSYATGYDYIRNKFSLAMNDPDVLGIVFDVNSPGGHVMGNFELADMIYSARDAKPSLALVDGMAYSGGYSLGSSASRMSVIQSAGVGSIGVVMMHASVEQMLSKYGVDINFIYAGDHKVDGNPFQALPDDVRARFQASVDKSYEKFVSLVARNRGMSADDVRATQAACFDAEEALALGLIDAIQTPAEALAAFRQGLSGSNTNPQQGAKKMSTATAATGGDGNASVTVDTTAPAAEAAAPAAAAAAAVETPAPDAAATERARVKGITTCEEAKGRESLAQHFAYETNMSVEDARAALAKAPVAAAASAASPFAAAMDSTPNPNVGASGGAENEVSKGDQMANALQKATGIKLRD